MSNYNIYLQPIETIVTPVLSASRI